MSLTRDQNKQNDALAREGVDYTERTIINILREYTTAKKEDAIDKNQKQPDILNVQ